MPKIRASTVVLHREEQRAALVAAARHLVVEGGVSALTFATIAERAHIARPTVYEYFPTKADLLIALVEDEAPAWHAEVLGAVSRTGSPEDALRVFVRTLLKLVKNGRHEVPFALAAADLEPSVQRAMTSAHEALFAIVAPALTELGVADPSRCIAFVGGAVRAAGERLRHHRNDAVVIEQAVTFVVGGVQALARPRRSHPRAG